MNKFKIDVVVVVVVVVVVDVLVVVVCLHSVIFSNYLRRVQVFREKLKNWIIVMTGKVPFQSSDSDNNWI